MNDFVHLHLHTTYSLLDGQCQINPLVLKARKWGMPALAVTDHGNLFALKAFYDACKNTKKKFAEVPPIKPILGCEAYVTSAESYLSRDKDERRYHLCLHALNLTGYHNLVKLISEAHIHGFYRNARIDHELLAKYHEGLHCSSACIAGEIAHFIRNDQLQAAEKWAKWYKELFGDNYSLEVMLHKSTKTGDGIPIEARKDFADLYNDQVKVVKGMLELGKKLNIRVIATNDVHFLNADDDDSHDALLALSTGTTLADSKRMIYTGQEYFKTADEMAELFKENPELLKATLEVAEKVETYKLDSDPIMPKFEIPASFGSEEDIRKKYPDEEAIAKLYPEGRVKKLGGYDKVVRIQFEADYLSSMVWEGAKKRWGEPLEKSIGDRLQFELDTIRTMGFPGYFLIVHDYIDAARRIGVWVGPGRGSAAGSAVAYALGITNVDPLKFDLLFERFLNPDRISMPDIDVDFDDAGRERVIEYVTHKYGADHVAHIVTFGQMAAKSAIKDVGRVMGYDLKETNKLASHVPDTPKIDFATARKQSADLEADFTSDDPVVHKLMERAEKLEGSIRQPGVHACGIIISRDPLIETLPVMPTPEKGSKKAKGAPQEEGKLLTTQYDGHFVEPVGLLKMDFLGLKTLTVEKECVSILGPNNPRVPERLRDAKGFLDTDKIPDDDKETYQLFGRGETTGLFQFESPGMKKWLRALQPEKLTDLVAMNALYRPGPMDYIPTFVARKQGREPIKYDHPLMEDDLRDTYGVSVYQEQVMLLSRRLAGFTRGESDKLRKAMGKKQLDTMAELKGKFIKGCLSNPEFTKETLIDFDGYELNADKTDLKRDAQKNPIGKHYAKLVLSNNDDALVLIYKIWQDWTAFASYAFNKSHAVCYAWVAYQTGYLKAHYPAEFMCAQISSEIGNFDKLPGFVAEAQEMGLKLMLPDVNESGARFVPTKDAKGIRYGLGGIKGVGTLAAETIVEEREKNGPYTGFLDFCMRLAGSNVINKRVLENLTRTGAFSSLEPNRAKLFNNIEFALKRSSQRAKEKSSAQMSFFDDLAEGGKEEVSDAALRDCPFFVAAEDLKNERDMLGVYISGDPLAVCRPLVKALSVVDPNRKGAGVQPFSLDKMGRGDEGETGELGDAGDTATLETGEDEEGPKAEEEDDSIEGLLKQADTSDWILSGFARSALRRRGELTGVYDKVLIKTKVSKEKPKVRKTLDKALLKKVDVRLVGILSGCSIKVQKPRQDGTPGKKWAILTIDDGLGKIEGACFANVWQNCATLENKVDQLVMVCGEIAHKANYAKEDAGREHPQVGDIGLTVREAYPLEEAMPLLTDALNLRLRYSDPKVEEKLTVLRKAIDANPGHLPVHVSLFYPDGKEMIIDLGDTHHVAMNISFLAELEKVFPDEDVAYAPKDNIYLAQRGRNMV